MDINSPKRGQIREEKAEGLGELGLIHRFK